MVEGQEIGVFQVVTVPSPLVAPVHGLDQVEVGWKVVPEVIVAPVIHRRRFIVPIDFPVAGPVPGGRDVHRELPEHVLGVLPEPQNHGPERLVGNIPHAESLPPREGRLEPLPHRVSLEGVG